MADPIERPHGTHEIYRPRRFEGHAPWRFADKRLKPITISYRLNTPPFAFEPETVAAARQFTEALIPEMDALGGHFDLGFVVLHQGEAANWLLFDWWIEGGIACQILCRSTLDQPTRFERVSQPYLACVWEAAAIAHERDAWVATMMCDQPDPDAYLERRILSGAR